MKLNQFKKIYNLIGKDGFAYFIPITEQKRFALSRESNLIVEELKKKSQGILPININVSKCGNYVTLQNIPPKGIKTNSICVRHDVLMGVKNKLGLDIDNLIRDRAIFVKSFESCKEQERRKKLSESSSPKPIGDKKVDINLKEWIDETYLKLKAEATKSEQSLYNRLHKTFKERLKRQVPFVINGKVYYADLCLKSMKVIIEVDGGYHNTEAQQTKDKERDKAFSSIGYKTIRCTNEQVKNKQYVKQLIQDLLEIKGSKER